MFVDEKKAGEAQVATDPFNLDGLIAWLEKQPADKVYSWLDPELCLVGQFAKRCGVRPPINLEGDFAKIAFGYSNKGIFDTFGAALSRAIALRDQKMNPIRGV